MPARRAADHIDQPLDPTDRNAGEPRRLLIAADRDDLPAKAGAADDEGRGGNHHRHDDDLRRNAEDAAKRDELERLVLEHLQIAVGQHLRDAAAGDEQDQRGDDRLDRIAGDQHAVEPAELRAATIPAR